MPHIPPQSESLRDSVRAGARNGFSEAVHAAKVPTPIPNTIWPDLKVGDVT